MMQSDVARSHQAFAGILASSFGALLRAPGKD
jgi:hypothetical protein